MDYQGAVASFRKNPGKLHLNQLTRALCDEMTLREKTSLLHGGYVSFVTRVLYGAIFKSSMFYLPFMGGGCRRLGIPRYTFSDGPKGSVTGHGTCFPVAMLRGASFDPELESRIGTAIAREIMAQGANFFAGICINLVRNPRGGRSQESYGEDPWLTGQMGSALVKAVQSEGVIACVKHFALNSIENLRFLASANTDERTLREIYLFHFKKCIDAGAMAIMGAYNKVGGVYCCENRHLLQEILREEWGFDGFVMSDFLWGVHGAAASLKAGLDSEMPMPRFYNYANIRRCIQHGDLKEEDVNIAARRILGVMIRQTPNLRPQTKAIMKCQVHLDLAREAAVKGMVLLKNEQGLLPLSPAARIAVVGSYADTVTAGDKGSSSVLCQDGITPYVGLRRKFSHVALYNGTDPLKALKAAASADTVIVCVGCSAKDEGEFLIHVGKRMAKKPAYAIGGDRDTLHLNPFHLELLKTLKQAGKKVIAVLYTGSVILTGNLEDYTDAIIIGFYGGIGFGDALAALLSGEENFSGKLPVSIAAHESDYPPFLDIGQRPYEIDYGYYMGYYLFEKNDTRSAYPFGYGLSYTRFSISDAKAEKNDHGGISVTAVVKNTGAATGAEVVQVYVGSAWKADHSTRVVEHRPFKMLRGFQRIPLVPGECRLVHLDIAADDLKFYDVKTKTWVLDPKYLVYIGNSSAEVRLIGEIDMK